MFVKFEIPDKAAAAINGSKPLQRAKILKKIEDKIRLLFIENSHNVYSDINNYTSFDGFLNSFIVTKNDGDEIDWFYDEENLRGTEDIKNFEFENNLFEGQIEIKKQDDYIQRSDKLKVDIRIDLEEYLSDDFWKEFDKEGR